MPVSEVMFETNDPVTARLALEKVLGAEGYTIQENSLGTITAKHHLSLNRYGHSLEIIFDPATKQCINTTIVLRIDHRQSKDYIKSLVGALAGVLPNMRITSIKPDMSIDVETKKSEAQPGTMNCIPLEPLAKKWECQNCGFENEVTLERCSICGANRHAFAEPEVSSPNSETNEITENDQMENGEL